jgi:hypothetical protein
LDENKQGLAIACPAKHKTLIMNSKQNWKLITRIHQLLILVLLVFSLFVKPEVKKVFWLIIAGAVLSLMIQMLLYGVKEDSFGDKITKHPHQF